MIQNLKKVIFTLSFLVPLSTIKVQAHIDRNKPVGELPGISGVVDHNRAGYGWLNASSEVEAETFFFSICKDKITLPMGKKLDCGGPQLTPLTQVVSNTFFSVNDTVISKAVGDALKNKLAEYFQLQAASLGDPPTPLPSCLNNKPEMKKLSSEIQALKGMSTDQLEAHILNLKAKEKGLAQNPKLNGGSKHLKIKKDIYLALKLRAVKASFDQKRASEALLLLRHLSAQKDKMCKSSRTADKLECMNIKRSYQRIAQSFPVISNSTNGVRDMCGFSSLDQLHLSVSQIVGQNGVPSNISSLPSTCKATKNTSLSRCNGKDDNRDRLICRGTKKIDAIISKSTGFDKLVNNNDYDYDMYGDGIWNQSYEAATNLLKRSKTNPPTSMPDKFAVQAAKAVNNSYNMLKNDYRKTLSNNLQQLCANGQNDWQSLADKYPHVLRQLVLDEAFPDNKENIKKFLCYKGIMQKNYHKTQTHSCLGVKTMPDGTVHVERPTYDFPYASDTNYNITRLPDGSFRVKTKINYQFHYDSSIDPTSSNYGGDAKIPSNLRATKSHQKGKYDSTVQNWITKTNQYFNRATAKVKDPKVIFEIEPCDPSNDSSCNSSREPKVKVSTCYRAENDPPATFATDFPGKTWDKHSCLFVRKYGNWQDAGNFTMDNSENTLFHENGHLLGLNDEYSAPYYPAHALGEKGRADGGCASVMSGSTNGCYQFFGRHISEIVRPAQINCSTGKGPADL